VVRHETRKSVFSRETGNRTAAEFRAHIKTLLPQTGEKIRPEAAPLHLLTKRFSYCVGSQTESWFSPSAVLETHRLSSTTSPTSSSTPQGTDSHTERGEVAGDQEGGLVGLGGAEMNKNRRFKPLLLFI